MGEDIVHFVTRICSCVKPPHINPVAPFGTITTTQPMEIVSIDFFNLNQCSGGYEYLLVVTNHFTRYTQAYPTRNKAPRTAAERMIFNDFLLKSGMPKYILDDQGMLYEVQPEKSQDGKMRRILHRNMLLPCEIILEEPEGFHLKKEKHKKSKQAASHKFVNNTSNKKAVKMSSKG